jgi:outer membrane protein
LWQVRRFPGKSLAYALLIGLLFHPDGLAQSPVTLQQCLSLAHKNHAALKISELTIQQTLLQQQELSTTRLPQLSLIGGVAYAPLGAHFGYDPAISNEGQLLGQVALKHTLYDGGARSLKLEQYDVTLTQLRQEHRVAQRDIDQSVKAAYLEALRSRDEVILQHMKVDQLTTYYELVKRLNKAGAVSATDVLKTEIELTGATSDLQNAELEQKASMYQLAQSMLVPLDSVPSIDGDIGNPLFETIDIKSSDRDSAFRNIDVAIAESEIQKSMYEESIARTEEKASVNLVADVGILTSIQNLRLPADERSPYYGLSLGIEVGIPLLTWGAIDLRVQQKQIATDIEREKTAALSRTLGLEHRKLLMQHEAAQRRRTLMQQNIAKAEDHFLLLKSTYAGGGSSALEVLAAQQLLSDSRMAILTANVELRSIEIRLEQLSL